jgi:nickel-type superoxide dismutase maturation protease
MKLPFRLFRVQGESMLPAYKAGTIVVALNNPKKFKTGDVIILEHDGLLKIKRISRINKGQVYLLGDNQNMSKDSRQFGWVSASAITGIVAYPKRGLGLNMPEAVSTKEN